MLNPRKIKCLQTRCSVCVSLSIKSARKAHSYLALFSILTILSSCTSLSTQQSFDKPDWQAGGKIALRFREGDRLKNHQLSFRWREQNQLSLVEFFSVLGQRVFYIEEQSHAVVLVDAQGKLTKALSIAELTSMQLGVALPLDSMDQLMFDYDREGFADQLAMMEWQVNKLDFVPIDVSADQSPQRLRKIMLTGPDSARIVLVVKEFEIN